MQHMLLKTPLWDTYLYIYVGVYSTGIGVVALATDCQHFYPAGILNVDINV